MSKKRLKIIGTIIAFILCFPFHGIYDKFPNTLTSIFFPVNESIWEHMKILFTTIMVSSVIQKIIMYIKKEDVTNICFSNFIGAISSIPIFLILFLPIYYLFGENFPLTILIMLITIIISQIIAYRLLLKPNFKMENKTILLVILVYTIFTILTYNPLNLDIFVDSTQCICGLK